MILARSTKCVPRNFVDKLKHTQKPYEREFDHLDYIEEELKVKQ